MKGWRERGVNRRRPNSSHDEEEEQEAAQPTPLPTATTVMPAPLSPVATTSAPLTAPLWGRQTAQTGGLTDDEDDDDDQQLRDDFKTVSFARTVSSPMEATTSPSVPPLTANCTVLPGAVSVNATTASGPPPVLWGRKAGRSVDLEEDAPDNEDLAFATASVPPSRDDQQVGLLSDFDEEGKPPAVSSSDAASNHRHNSTTTNDVTSMSEEEQLKQALEASQIQLQQDRSVVARAPLSDAALDEIKDNVRSLRQIVQSQVVDAGFLSTVVSMCREDQRKVAQTIEDTMMDGTELTNMEQLETLIDLNSNILDAIERAQEKTSSHNNPENNNNDDDHRKPAATPTVNTAKRPNLDVQDLVEKRDIFSLICMLRVQQNEKRLDAALALMRFARFAEQGKREFVVLRDEICSSGGLHSLLRLFGTKGISGELKTITALAVAYVLPCVVESSSAPTSPSLGLRIIECLRFLVSAQTVSVENEQLKEDEMFESASRALTTFWVHQLEPLLNSKQSKVHLNGETLRRSVSMGRQRGRLAGQRLEFITLNELLEMTVSTIIFIAKHEAEYYQNTANDSIRWSHTLIEQVCAVEMARPIAVRSGVLQILVSWIRSDDWERIRPAASALSYVTSINDKYMAGWIHSEIVNNKWALPCLTEKTRDIGATHDFRLAVAQILSGLCAASHTRAAVAEANCVHFLIGSLYEHNDPASEELAYYSGLAVMQLAEGALSRASGFPIGDLEKLDAADKRDALIRYVGLVVQIAVNLTDFFRSDIVGSGAISSFVSIAQNRRRAAKLRSVAVQALRIISEDVSEKRKTRRQLCEDAAAMALGTTLHDNFAIIGEDLKMQTVILEPNMQNALRDLHEGLCALANILDPVMEAGGHPTRAVRSVSSNYVREDPLSFLIRGCLDTTSSGGLQSLLDIASLPFVTTTLPTQSNTNLELLEETCRSLAYISPLLFMSKVAAAGHSKWAHDVFQVFQRVLVGLHDGQKGQSTTNELAMELWLHVLQGLGSLGKCDALQVRIIDKSLPFLLQSRNIRDQSEVSTAASQAFQSLGLAEDEIASQVAGNTPNVFAEWFCLQRSLLLQAMARAEIKQVVCNKWRIPFQQTRHGLTDIMPSMSISDYTFEELLSETALFYNFADDSHTAANRNNILSQYNDVYGGRYSEGKLTMNSRCSDEDNSLLSEQVYPLGNSDTETEWILEHGQSILGSETTASRLSDHVNKLLAVYFPSNILRNKTIPISMLRPEASYNFRALMMAQRKYFSFRREGQLLSSLCDDETASLGSMDVHWTLGFMNSSFGGEFSESLVQVLYKCPMICGISFVSREIVEPEGGENGARETVCDGELLANLVGSLPRWISHVTFEGFLSDADLATLIAVLETTGTLSTNNFSENSDGNQTGVLHFFAIRCLSNIQGSTWDSFFKLLGSSTSTVLDRARPLSTLKCLDLSGNMLGDKMCASLLSVVFTRRSDCHLEELDLSQNRIQSAANVLKVLRAYCHGRESDSNGWKATLHTLLIGSNGILGKAWLEIVALIGDDGLCLKHLDLSSNSLVLEDRDYEFANTMVHTLKQSRTLELLNLSRNQFSSSTVDHVIRQLNEGNPGNAILLLDENQPPLSAGQSIALSEASTRTRKCVLQSYLERDEQIENEPSSPRSAIAPSESQTKYPALSDKMKPTVKTDELSPMGLGAGPGDNLITVLFSAPLVFTNGRTLRPFAKLDFDLERELIWQCLKEASRDIELSFDSATHERLLATMAKRCSCLHYSGHGHQQYLPFEDGSGGPYWFKVDQFKSLIEKEGTAPFRFVFVSACYSYLAGETFASAGVPHVVCCQQESELKDTAALAFTRQFYLALAIGHTVKQSFDQGCKAVRATPNLRNPDQEMKKFLLLPEDGNHDVPIFNAKPVAVWPKQLNDEIQARSRRLSGRSLVKPKSLMGGARGSELSVRNMMQDDPSPSPPEFFIGREVDMYYVLKAVLGKRLVSVIGEPGVGRSSLACALCHYINERASTMIGIERMYFVKAKKSQKRNPFRRMIKRFLDKLAEDEKALPIDPEAEMEEIFDTICRRLKHEKALVVFDRLEQIADADEASEFPVLLSKLTRETKHVKVLITNRHDLGIPSLGEHPISLGPLNFCNTVRLFSNLCPYLHTPSERKIMFDMLVTDAEQAELLPSDPGLGVATKGRFELLGDGTWFAPLPRATTLYLTLFFFFLIIIQGYPLTLKKLRTTWKRKCSCGSTNRRESFKREK